MAVVAVALLQHPVVGSTSRWRWRALRAGAAAARDATRVLFAAVWLLAELARAVIFTGFPWIASGYAQVDSPLAGYAPWVGVYGIGLIGAALAAWLALSRPWQRGWRGGTIAAAGVAVVLGGGAVAGLPQFSEAGNRLTRHAAPGQRAAGREVRDRTAAGDDGVDPRTPAGGARRRSSSPRKPSFRCCRRSSIRPTGNRCCEHFQRGSQAAIVGLPLGDEAVGYTNSAAAISAATPGLPGGYYRYDKHHLVPFGEFIPTGFRWFTRLMNIPLGDFNRGAARPAVVRLARRAHRARTSATKTCSARSWRRASPIRRRRRRSSPTSATSPGSARPSPSTSTCRSRGCARSSSSGRCCAPPTPAPPW